MNYYKAVEDNHDLRLFHLQDCNSIILICLYLVLNQEVVQKLQLYDGINFLQSSQEKVELQLKFQIKCTQVIKYQFFHHIHTLTGLLEPYKIYSEHNQTPDM